MKSNLTDTQSIFVPHENYTIFVYARIYQIHKYIRVFVCFLDPEAVGTVEAVEVLKKCIFFSLEKKTSHHCLSHLLVI